MRRERASEFANMIYREFGKTGIKVSSLGFGCMRLPMTTVGEKRVVDDEKTGELLQRAFDLGVNYFDTAWMYCEHDGQRAVGKAIKPFRDKIYLSTKSPMYLIKKTEDFRDYLMRALEQMDESYIDFYHFHGINLKTFEEQILPLKLIDEAEKLKSEGLIRHLSFSFHDDAKHMKTIADAGVFSSVLCQYNLIDRANEESIAYVHDKGLGVVVMGPVAGGNISAGGEKLLSRFDTTAKTAEELAFRFVLGNKNVSVALSGMQNLEMLEENVRYAELADSVGNAEFVGLQDTIDELVSLRELYCSGCKYCDVCPKGIQPFRLFRAYNKWKVWGIEKDLRELYAKMKTDDKGAKIDACVSCGKCASRCPQNIKIAEMMKTLDEKVRKEFNF